MKNLLIKILSVAIGVCVLCCCQNYQHSAPSSLDGASAFEKCMVNDVKKSKPWELSKPSHGDPDTGGGLAIVFEDELFHKGVDDPRKLLIRAREGDYQASRKLQDYVFQEKHPDWAVKSEFERMFAFEEGIYGIAQYYGENKRNWGKAKDRRLIEQALRHMESEALGGNWIYAIALYQFLGTLNQHTDEHLPWGENEELSAKWLEIIYKSAGKQAFKAVVINESYRMGNGAKSKYIDGTYFPHTPDGWKPTN